MKIENATTDDINEIAVIMKEIADIHINARPDVFKEKNIKDLVIDVKKSLESKKEWILIAKEYNIVKGILMCKLKTVENHPNLKGSKILWIDDIGVNSKFQKQGIGKILVDKAIELAKQNDCIRVDLNCWKLNENALQFYKKIGMLEQREILEFKIEYGGRRYGE